MTSPTPRYDDSLDFLRRWRPDGPWLLTAIGLDKTGIETRAFRADQEGELRKWLEAQGAHRNIYFSVNPTFPAYIDRAAADGRSKKTEATDIEAMVCLHVDLDPREGEDVAAEQRRIRERLTTNLPAGVPPPTLVVFSGGGCQGFWALREPVRLDGSKAAAEDAKRWNLQLEVVFGADHCHNIDRIMRLPGTVNWPDSKKKAKGRTAALAEVVEWHPERAYDIGQFTKAPEVQAAGAKDVGAAGVAQRVKVSGNVKRYNGDIDAVPGADKLTPKARVVIVQGIDPDEPHKFGGSRSEWLLFACCAMVRAGFDDDTMYAVITDPAFGISASVLDKGSATEKYAIRQIERGKEEAVDPWLRRLNERFAVVQNWNGKCRVIEEVWDEGLRRYKLTKQSFDDFRNAHMNIGVQVGTSDKGVPITKPLGQWWLQHAQRRQFRTVVFEPGREVPGAYNLWKGFAAEARPGDWSLMERHVREVLAAGDEAHARYILDWAAWAVQNPDKPAEVAIAFRGGQGTGKGTFARALCAIFGQHALQVSRGQHIFGRFNNHLRDCVLLYADEVSASAERESIGELKRLITEPTLTIEPKGVDAEAAPNRLHVVMTSNEDWVAPMDSDDRRFVVFDVAATHKEDDAWFGAINTQMESGGLAAMLHSLLTRPLDDWHPRRNRPMTAAMAEQKAASLRGAEAAWFECLTTGELPRGSVQPDGSARIDTAQLLDWARRFRARETISANQVSALLRGPETHKANQKRERPGMGFEKRRSNGGPNFWVVPPLAECRNLWDERRFAATWDAADGWAISGDPGVF